LKQTFYKKKSNKDTQVLSIFSLSQRTVFQNQLCNNIFLQLTHKQPVVSSTMILDPQLSPFSFTTLEFAITTKTKHFTTVLSLTKAFNVLRKEFTKK
jgi:hypothetical protein